MNELLRQAMLPALFAADDVLPMLFGWRADGLKTALVTVVGIEGAAPRPVGAHMAVAEDGRFIGYLSGGCLEQAVVLEAQRAIHDGRNRLVRYGKGSPYIDVKLPCESGIDLYFDQGLSDSVLQRIADGRRKRIPMVVRTDLQSGRSDILDVTGAGPASAPCVRDGWNFSRLILPDIRLMLIGGGPSVGAIARLIRLLGLEIEVHSPDATALDEVRLAGCPAYELKQDSIPNPERLDTWSAAALAFHEHAWEPPILAQLLQSKCFYIGALGSRAVHASRVAALRERGFAAEDLARIRAPIGLIPGARSRATIGLGVVAELVAEAKTRGFLS
jgi:xanthine dehydrogenase accessory factor